MRNQNLKADLNEEGHLKIPSMPKIKKLDINEIKTMKTLKNSYRSHSTLIQEKTPFPIDAKRKELRKYDNRVTSYKYLKETMREASE